MRGLLGRVMQALALLVALQVSGAVHAAVELAGACAATAEGKADCTEPGDCPPGCPSCHAHGPGALPAPARAAVLVRLDAPEAVVAPLAAWPPSSPDLPPLFRPPRLA